jgi:hypothetical protein
MKARLHAVFFREYGSEEDIWPNMKCRQRSVCDGVPFLKKLSQNKLVWSEPSYIMQVNGRSESYIPGLPQVDESSIIAFIIFKARK